MLFGEVASELGSLVGVRTASSLLESSDSRGVAIASGICNEENIFHFYAVLGTTFCAGYRMLDSALTN